MICVEVLCDNPGNVLPVQSKAMDNKTLVTKKAAESNTGLHIEGLIANRTISLLSTTPPGIVVHGEVDAATSV